MRRPAPGRSSTSGSRSADASELSGRQSEPLPNGELTTIDYPGAQATAALGINERGDIVGGYIDAAGKPRGYLMSR